MDYVPEVSAVDEMINAGIMIEDDVSNMLSAIGFGNLQGVTKVQPNQNKRGL